MNSDYDSQLTSKNYKMSWTSYVMPLIIFIGICSVGIVLSINWIPVSGVLAFILAVALFIYHILSIRSVSLFMDDEGVWVSSGIFPWSRGITGIKWQNLESVAYFPSFWSWTLRSYTIRIGHRFVQSGDIVLEHISHGNIAVEEINRIHSQILSLSAS